MDRTLDELAGVVDLFGALTRDELAEALHELAFKQGRDVDDDAVEAAIENALDQYALVRVDRDDVDALIVPGPTAFPAVPEGGMDLPHILDVDRRDVPRNRLGDALESRFEAELGEADDDRLAFLFDVTYDAETWADVDADALRERIDERREG